MSDEERREIEKRIEFLKKLYAQEKRSESDYQFLGMKIVAALVGGYAVCHKQEAEYLEGLLAMSAALTGTVTSLSPFDPDEAVKDAIRETVIEEIAMDGLHRRQLEG